MVTLLGLNKQVLDEHASVQQIQLRNNQLPWISPSYEINYVRNSVVKSLLPNNKFNTAGTNSIHPLDDGKLTSNNNAIFKHFFVNPKIQDSPLSFTEEDQNDRRSIAAIKSSHSILTLLLRK